MPKKKSAFRENRERYRIYFGSATIWLLGPKPALRPALARRFCLRSRRASFSSNPACFALPLSSRASMTVSANVLYAVVFRIGSVDFSTAEETAEDARDI